MICELDLGNTNCQWRMLGENNQVTAAGKVATKACEESLAALHETPSRLRISSVAGAQTDRSIANWVAQHWQIEPEFARTLSHHGGIQIAYADPARLGVDRWLAMLAAYREFAGPVCVMDLGSAATVDLVNADGQHQGGYIVPGIELQRRMLVKETGRIQADHDVEKNTISWGASSEECIAFGVRRMLQAFLGSIFEELEMRFANIPVCVAGGSALLALEQDWDKIKLVERPNLVLDGLAIALP